MNAPARVQLSRAKGWRMPENTVKVDRTTKWGNPYEAWRDEAEGWLVTRTSCHWPATDKAAALALAVKLHAEWLRAELAKEIYQPAVMLGELRGKNLACWCKPGQPCHADVLLELANR
jgi:hypothetical protein